MKSSTSIDFEEIRRISARLRRHPVVVRFLVSDGDDECIALIRRASKEVGVSVFAGLGGVPVEGNQFVPRRMIVAVMSDDTLRLIDLCR